MDFDEEAPVEDFLSSGEEDTADERKHNQLLDALSSLDGKKRSKLSQRTVLSTQVSEFNFSSSKDKSSVVSLNELVGSLKDSASHGDLKNQLRNVTKKSKTVSTPLPRHEKEKIDRATAYETTAGEFSKWDPIVKKNRKAEQIRFPLERPDLKIVTTDQLVKRFQPRTPLERQVAALLQGSEHVIHDEEQELTQAEQRALKAMDIEEAKKRRIELMKHRALLSYKEAKAKRQKKIKSKRYHRVLKKERLKNERKQLDKLQEEDPEGYQEKLNQLEKDRAEERVSLKHRGGSKFAKRQMIYAKFDGKARQDVQDMFQKSRDLTKKVDVQSDSDDDQFPDTGVSIDNTDLDDSAVSHNPWMARPTSGKSGSSNSRPQVVNEKISKGENDQSEYSRPEELVNKEVDDNDDDDEEEEEEEAEQEEDEVVQEEAVQGEVELGEKEADKGKGKNRSSGIENVKNSKKKKNEKVLTGTPKIEVHDLSAMNSDEILCGKTIDEIFDNKQSSKLKPKNVKKNNKSKNKKLKDKKSKSEKTKDAQTRNKDKIDEQSKDIGKKLDKSDNVSSKNDKNRNDDEVSDEYSDEDEQINNESLHRKRTIEEYEEMIATDSGEEVSPHKKQKTGKKKLNKKDIAGADNKTTSKNAFVDPKKLFTIGNRIKQIGSAPNVIEAENDDDEDADEQQRLTIAQAFADDDVIEEFSREKEDKIEKSKPKDINLTLPGWGSWGGEGIKISQKKRKRFIIKAPPALPRKDSHLGNVILNEERMAAVAKHMVHDIPFPYMNAEQFEKSIRAPLGKTWNPQTVHNDLVKPKIVTSLGKIIHPMDKSEVSKYLKNKAKTDTKDMNILKNKSEKNMDFKSNSKKPVKRLDKHKNPNFKSNNQKNKGSNAKQGKGKKK